MNEANEQLRFEQLPGAVGMLIQEVKELKSIICKMEQKQSDCSYSDSWMSITDLRNYLPEHPSKATIYGWVCNKQIPYYKVGKRLSFKKSEIDKWVEDSSSKVRAQFHPNSKNSYMYHYSNK